MSITFTPGFKRHAGKFLISGGMPGAWFVFQIDEHDMRDLLGVGEARWEEAMVTKRAEIEAACLRAAVERPKSPLYNVVLQLTKQHFEG